MQSSRKENAQLAKGATSPPGRKQPMYIKKKKNANKSLEMQKQFSSTLQNEDNNASVPQDEPFTQQDAGQVASAQVPKGKDPFDQINQNSATDFCNIATDLDVADNPSQQRRPGDELAPVDVEQANPPLVDLSSTSNIMDAILNNLQGLTPEQEEVRKQIEERSRLIQEQAKKIQQASHPISNATSERGPNDEAGAEEQQSAEPQRSGQNLQGFLTNNPSEMQQRKKRPDPSAENRKRKREHPQDELGRELQIDQAPSQAKDSEIDAKPLFEETPNSLLHSNDQPNSMVKNATDQSQTLRAEDQLSGISSQVRSFDQTNNDQMRPVVSNTGRKSQTLQKNQTFGKLVQGGATPQAQNGQSIPNFMKATATSALREHQQAAKNSLTQRQSTKGQRNRAESKDKYGVLSNGGDISQRAGPSALETSQKRHLSRSGANVTNSRLSHHKRGGVPTGDLPNSRNPPSINDLTSAEVRSLKDRSSPAATPRSLNNTSKKAVTQRARLHLSGTGPAPTRGRSNANRTETVPSAAARSTDRRRTGPPPINDPRVAVKPNDNTMQIQHVKIQREIEKAIKDVNDQEADQLTYPELKKALMGLDYLPTIRAFEKHKPTSLKSPTFIDQLQEEKDLLDGLWTYLNPAKAEYVEKSITFDVLLILMFNANKSHKELMHLVAPQIVDYYQQFDIDLQSKPPADLESSDTPQPPVTAIEAMDQHFANDNLHLSKFIQSFKSVHLKRVGARMLNESSMERSSKHHQSFLADPSIRRNKSLQKIMPKDNRRYKEQQLQELVMTHTFQPNMAPKSKQLAAEYHKKILAARSKSRENLKKSIKLTDNPYVPSTFYGQNQQDDQNIRLFDDAAGEEEEDEAAPYELQKFRRQRFEEKINAQRELERRKEDEQCTFAPKTNLQANQQIASKYMSRLSNSQLRSSFQDATEDKAPKNAMHEDFQQSNQANFLASFRGGEPGVQKGMKANPKAMLDEKELEQCTFKPKINSLDPKKANLYGIGVKVPSKAERKKPKAMEDSQNIHDPVIEKVHHHLEQILENDVPKQMPKGYAKTVERLRKHKEAQDKVKHEEELKGRGQRYGRDKLERMKPPSFVTNPERHTRRQQRKNQLLLSIEVSISPHKSGRIGIKEGDDLRKLAQNFCKAYSLHKDMEDSLVEQLEGHLRNYRRLQELKKLQEEEDREQKRRQRAHAEQANTFQTDSQEIPNELKEQVTFNDQLKMALQLSNDGFTPGPGALGNYTHDLDLSKIQELPSGLHTNDAQNSMNDEDTVHMNKSPTHLNVLEQIRQANEGYHSNASKGKQSHTPKDQREFFNDINNDNIEQDYASGDYRTAAQIGVQRNIDIK